MVWKHDRATGADGKARCGWVSDDPLYQQYHDREWGRPLKDDRALFELLTLEGCQAGLSWITVLRKREHYRKVYDGFDPAKIALAPNPFRPKGAPPYAVQEGGELRAYHNIPHGHLPDDLARRLVLSGLAAAAKFLWSFVGGKPKKNSPKNLKDVPAKSPESDAMSKALQKAGFKFVGSTICYAFMQASGMVDDHVEGCHRSKA